ncbi:MAG: hypothetical protein H6772_04155 [Pseudomonadales bacterium]|nr:hypothetical protein [Pseudomonadales bacterium]
MIIIRNFILFIFKILILLLVVTFEKIVGLPVIFITLQLVFYLNENSFYKYLYLILSAIFLGLVYEISFSISLFLIICIILAINYGANFIRNDIYRVLVLIYGLIVVIAMMSKIVLSFSVIGYFVISVFLMILILMRTLFSRHGLAEKIAGKRSNFFR